MFSRYRGKILSVIQKEGFFAGAGKIFMAAFRILRPVGSGDILFVSSGVVGNSSRYRVLNVAEELTLHGFKCSFTVQENPLLPSYADKFQIFIFHQVTQTPQVAALIKKIKVQGKEIVFETDDLLFDAAYVKEQDFFKNSNALMKKYYENNVGSELVGDAYVKVCTTTTTFLAAKLHEHGKQVFIVPNKLTKNDIEIAEKINKKCHSGLDPESKEILKQVQNDNMIKIGYFSGELSHNKDFATITDVLMNVMEKHANVELFLAGPLDVDNVLNKFVGRIKQLPYVPREKHFTNVASVDINIAPLEIGNPFCESKSELKFFEAGIVKVPTVASATQTFREAINDGIDGFVADGTEQWAQKLEQLITDENLRQSMGEKAYAKALEKYSVENSNNAEYYVYLKSKIKSL